MHSASGVGTPALPLLLLKPPSRMPCPSPTHPLPLTHTHKWRAIDTGMSCCCQFVCHCYYVCAAAASFLLQYDLDDNGKLDANEFVKMLQQLGTGLSTAETEAAMEVRGSAMAFGCSLQLRAGGSR